jgi:hypothetical protein
MFRDYQVHAKDIKCPLEWWEKHVSFFFSIVAFIRIIFLALWDFI